VTEPELTHMTHAEWLAEARRRFGENPANWRFVCPVCKHVASGADFKKAAAPPSAMAQECIGRYHGAESFADAGKGPCNYAGFGLFRLSPVRVKLEDGEILHSFAFAEPDATEAA